MTADAATALVAALALLLPILAAALLMWKWPRRRAAPGGEDPGGTGDAAAYAYAFDRPLGHRAPPHDADWSGDAGGGGGGDGGGGGGD